MTTIESITLETEDATAAAEFYAAAFGLGDRVRVAATRAPTSGFRGFTVSLVVAEPCDVDGFFASALAAGAEAVKPAAKSFWGYGGVLRDPFGTLWKIASSSKKNTRPAVREVEAVVLLLGVADVAATKQYYTGRGLEVTKSFGRKYVEFGTGDVKLALYGRKAAAKDAGVGIEGSGSHRLVINGGSGSGSDPDGFAWRAPVAATNSGPY